jgi:50S ribosomal subunit-associated GTPase HflX
MAARSGAIAISAADGTGIDSLLGAIERALPPAGTLTLRIPHGEGASLALCYERGRVLARRDTPGHVELDVDLPVRLHGALARYRVTDSGSAAGMID